jgi:hypothetical protein
VASFNEWPVGVTTQLRTLNTRFALTDSGRWFILVRRVSEALSRSTCPRYFAGHGIVSADPLCTPVRRDYTLLVKLEMTFWFAQLL